MPSYADPLLRHIDPAGLITSHLYRHHCSMMNGNFIKDLSKLGRNPRCVILLDNLPQSYILQPQNGLPIISWYDCSKDTQLRDILPLLEALSKVQDVRNVIPRFVERN